MAIPLSRQAERFRMSMFKSRYPISECCPRCGSREYTRRKPETAIAFSDDRVCNRCQARYTPPTPVWAGVVFILIGTVLVAPSAFVHIVHFLRPSGSFVSGFSVGCATAWPALIGIIAIVHGVRSLVNRKMIKADESIHNGGHRSRPRDITDGANKEAMIVDRCSHCGTIDPALPARGFCLHCQLDVNEPPPVPPAKRP
jgi:hypothetical protein